MKGREGKENCFAVFVKSFSGKNVSIFFSKSGPVREGREGRGGEGRGGGERGLVKVKAWKWTVVNQSKRGSVLRLCAFVCAFVMYHVDFKCWSKLG